MTVARVAALAALVIAVVVVAVLLLSGNGGTEYKVTLINAGQLVNGDDVQVGGRRVGSIDDISLTNHNQAQLKITVDSDFAPLHRGTTAVVRATSQSGVANRYLALSPGPNSAPSLPAGYNLPVTSTTSIVDLDQIFNTLNPKTVADFKHVIQGFEISYSGVGKQANEGFRLLNPFLSTSRRTFGELNSDEHALERLVVDTSELSGALAQRAPDLSLLIHNLNLMMGALASQSDALSASIAKLPGFMRQANTTFVNLRATLDDLDPLINASKPVADRLGPFFRTFRAAAADAVPTIRDLTDIVRRPGKQNDLVELTKDAVPLAKAGVGTGSPNCGQNPSTDYLNAADNNFTQGALGEANCALRNGLPGLAFFRPYTTELVGWFDDFGGGPSGIIDANGGIGRIATTFNAFTISPNGVPDFGTPFSLADVIGGALPGLELGNLNKCPGANERPAPDNSNPFTDNGTLACNPSEVPPGS
jgi:phospholipid/cholesterol/gamma-HCH transport system substrate-binding protein